MVGDRSPRDFLEKWHDCTLADYVAAYLSQLPHVHGIVLCNTWKQTFAAQEQFHRDEVRCRLLRYLDERRAEWEDLPAARQQRDGGAPGAGDARQEPDPGGVADIPPPQTGATADSREAARSDTALSAADAPAQETAGDMAETALGPADNEEEERLE